MSALAWAFVPLVVIGVISTLRKGRRSTMDEVLRSIPVIHDEYYDEED